jgi:hypothetical protein
MSKLIDAVADRVKEKTRIARLFRTNAKMRHGLPPDEEDLEIPTVQVEHSHTHEHKGLEKEREVVKDLNESVKEETSAVRGLMEAVREEKLPIAVPLPVDREKEEFREKETTEKIPNWLKKALLAASLVGGGSGATMLGNYFLSDPPTVESEKDGSLLQYLEDRGEHLPEGFE